jgi:hypothetical protein
MNQKAEALEKGKLERSRGRFEISSITHKILFHATGG